MNLLAKPVCLHCSPGCGAFWLFWMVLCSLLFHQLEIKGVFCTAGSLWWDHSITWAMATSCSYRAWLLCWIAVAKNCWASTRRAHTLSCLLSRCKWFAASWVHWAACIHAKACNSHELSVSGASAGNMKALSLIRSSTLLRVMANFTLLPFNVKCYWSCTSTPPLSASLRLPLSPLHCSFL